MASTRNRWGSGSIRRWPGRAGWELRVSAGRDPVTKSYRYMSRSLGGSKKEAEAALAALLTEVNSGTGGHKGSDATVRELVEQWLDLRKESLSVTTWEAYGAKARFRLFPALGDVAVRKLTVREIDAFYRAFAARARTGTVDRPTDPQRPDRVTRPSRSVGLAYG